MNAKHDTHEIQWTPEKISRIWDYYSQNSAYKDQYFALSAGKYVVKEVLQNVSNFKTLLDFSCGTGELLLHFLNNSSVDQTFYATDISKNSVQIVNERFKDTDRFVQAVFLDSIQELNTKQFDVIILTEVIEHLNDEDLSDTLTTCYNLLNKGGRLILTTPNNENLEANKTLCPDCGCIFHRWQHQRSFTKDSLETKVESFSFRTQVIKEIAWAHPIRKLLSPIKPLPKNGLFYIGVKN